MTYLMEYSNFGAETLQREYDLERAFNYAFPNQYSSKCLFSSLMSHELV